MGSGILDFLKDRRQQGKKTWAVLIDPEKFDPDRAGQFVQELPPQADLLLVGGSEVADGLTPAVVRALKTSTARPVVLFPGDVNQLCEEADALLYLSLLSGENPEYLVGQQVKAAALLRKSQLEVIPVGYVLIDGGNTSAVQRTTATFPLDHRDIERITNTAFAAQLMGKELVYLEAGSGASRPVGPEVIRSVRSQVDILLVVGGGIRTEAQRLAAFEAGADMVVMGNVFE